MPEVFPVFDARLSDLRDLTAYAPVRVALVGIGRVIFGLVVCLLGLLMVMATKAGEFAPAKPGDLPAWWIGVVGAAFAFTGVALLTGGLGRVVSAFARGCYFRAGAEGVAIRVPVYGWFGRYKLTSYAFDWKEIEQVLYFVRRLNLISFAREVRIRLYGGKEVGIERFKFAKNAKKLVAELVALRAQAGR